MTKEEEAKLLLKKYLDQKASPAEIAQVEQWYNSYQEHTSMIGSDKKAKIKENVLLNIRSHMTEGSQPVRLVWPALLRIAAMLFIVAAAGIFFWKIYIQQSISADQFITIASAAGEKKKVVLSDGSVILLEPSARLRYPEKFKNGQRLIELLEGEAFFTVAHDEKRPFTVKTSNDLYTKVLGTSFRIKSYRSSRNISIAVATGKVAVGNSRQLFGTLVKGQQIVYDKQDRHAAISYTPVPVYVNLVFEGTKLQEVFRKLEYAYNITINLSAPAVRNLKCTAIFNTKQKPEEILDIICSLHHLRFSKTEDPKTFNVYKK
eukprot:gene17853-21332_t